MPRKGTKANIIRRYLKVSPKVYRKLLVGLTNVVETKMCAKDWGQVSIIRNFHPWHHQGIRKTFMKNDEE